MAFDPNGGDAAKAAMNDALRAAYEQGQLDARAEILATLQGALKPSEQPSPVAVLTKALLVPAPRHAGGGELTRAPRGLLPAVLDKMLADQPGLKIREYENMAPSVDPRVSPRSISNELRRFEGVKYRRDGFQWFPIASTNNGPDTNQEEGSDPLSLSSDKGGANGTAITSD